MGRSPCCSKVGLHRGPWTTREDAMLVQYIHLHGEGNWRNMPKEAGLLRCGKSCRLRWMNYLRPDIKRGNITPDEDELILRLHSLLGNRWSLIAGRLPGRTDNEIKNYWNSHLQKKFKKTPTSNNITNIELSKKKKGPQKKNITTIKEEMHNEKSPKIHIPKPTRPPCFVMPRNLSFDSSMASGSPSFGEDDKGGDIDDALRVFDLPSWSPRFQDCGGSSFLDFGDETHDLEPYTSCQSHNMMLDQLYEEYQQLLKVEDDDNAHVNDAFVESLLD